MVKIFKCVGILALILVAFITVGVLGSVDQSTAQVLGETKIIERADTREVAQPRKVSKPQWVLTCDQMDDSGNIRVTHKEAYATKPTIAGAYVSIKENHDEYKYRFSWGMRSCVLKQIER